MSETYTLSYNRLKLPGRTFFLIKPQRICATVNQGSTLIRFDKFSMPHVYFLPYLI